MKNTVDILTEKETGIVEFNEFEAKLAEFESRFASVVYDLSNPDDEKRARSDRYQIGKVKSALDEAHKKLKAPLKARTDLIDAERKRIKDRLETVQNGIKEQIEAHETAIRKEAERIEETMQELLGACRFDVPPTSAQVEARINRIKAIEVDERLKYKQADAALAKRDALSNLDNLLEVTRNHEKVKADQEAERQAQAEREREEREKQIAKEAAEKAERETRERMEREHQAELDRQRKEQREKEAKAEQERKAEEAKKAKASHRKKIRDEAIDSFVDNSDLTFSEAEELVDLIASGEIAHIKIEF